MTKYKEDFKKIADTNFDNIVYTIRHGNISDIPEYICIDDHSDMPEYTGVNVIFRWYDHLHNYYEIDSIDSGDPSMNLLDIYGLDTLCRCNIKILEKVHIPKLTDKERKYLKDVIRPFRDRVKYICKNDYEIANASSGKQEFIRIYLKSDICTVSVEPFCLPFFEEGTMYEGLILNRPYTLSELNIVYSEDFVF